MKLLKQMEERGCGELIDLCKKCAELNCVGSFFCDDSKPDTHLTGYIDSYNDEELLIKHISPDGYYDGFVLVQTSDLWRIDVLGQYESRIATLYSLRKQTHPQIKCQNDSIYLSIMDFAYTNEYVVSVELERSVISGFVLGFDEYSLHVRVIDENGQEDGETIVLIENVISFAVDTSVEQKLKLLWQAGKG